MTKNLLWYGRFLSIISALFFGISFLYAMEELGGSSQFWADNEIEGLLDAEFLQMFQEEEKKSMQINPEETSSENKQMQTKQPFFMPLKKVEEGKTEGKGNHFAYNSNFPITYDEAIMNILVQKGINPQGVREKMLEIAYSEESKQRKTDAAFKVPAIPQKRKIEQLPEELREKARAFHETDRGTLATLGDPLFWERMVSYTYLPESMSNLKQGTKESKRQLTKEEV